MTEEDQSIDDQYRTWERLLKTVPDLNDSPEVLALNKNRFKHYRVAMKKFNEMTGLADTEHECTGIGAVQRHRNPHQCNEMFCPSRWMINQCTMLDAVRSIEAPYWYIRSTHQIEWNKKPTRETMRLFRAKHLDIKLVGWVINLISTRNADWKPSCYYQYVGVWVSRDRLDLRDQQIIRNKRVVGWVDQKVFNDRDLLEDAWVESNEHPAQLLDDPYCIQYRDGLSGLTTRYIQTDVSKIQRYLDGEKIDTLVSTAAN